MSFLSSLFKTAVEESVSVVTTDMHSHLIHDVDDGSDSINESLELIQSLKDLGYRKLIITPHIMNDYYKNSAENLLPKLEELKQAASDLDMELSVAAEYYLDDWFTYKMEENHPFMTFGDNHILVETSFLNRPRNLFDIFFNLQTQGYKVIFAHPERYIYLYDKFSLYEEIYERGVLFQINLNSLTGHYSPKSKKIVEKLISKKMVDLVGTDCHNQRHIEILKQSMKTKTYRKLLDLELLNDTL